MTLSARKVLVALVVVAPVAVVWLLSGCTQPAQVTLPSPASTETPPAEVLKKLPVGMSGCMGAACHGGNPQKTLEGQIDGLTWQSSGACWSAADPHTNAYAVLESELAKRIMDRYAKGTKATDDARCVACHTNPALARTDLFENPEAKLLRTEGVSCEACHGNAGKWLSEHTTWEGDRDKVYHESGMTPLYNLGERAKNCLGCHVGAPADPERGLPVRDMNHDMIAAGHPRLNFDFAEYLRRLPQHWQEKNRAKDEPLPPLNDVKVWYVGRVAHAEAACALLKDRAERAGSGDEKSPWPEFAEFNCAACHHHLSVEAKEAPAEEYPNWRRKEVYLGARPAGSIPWQMIWPLTNAPGIEKPERKNSELFPVLEVMEKPLPAKYGDAKRIATSTHAKLQQMRMALVGKPDAEIEREALAFFPKGAPKMPEWDSATQLFFGYAAMDRRKPATKEQLASYREAVEAFRKQNKYQNQMPNWLAVEKAFQAIRPEK